MMVETQWRPMTEEDLPSVSRIAADVHRDYPEDDAVFAERLALCPSGCLILASGRERLGYALSHPWRAAEPPPLNTPLGALPARPDTYYLHDVALLPAARGQGAAKRLLALLERKAGDLSEISLVAVGGTAGFWGRLGFTAPDLPGLAAKLANYGTGARYMRRNLSARSA